MKETTVELATVIDLAQELTPLEKVRLVEAVMSFLEEDMVDQKSGPRRPLYGILPGADISAEEIAEARKEMWGNFPREDI